MTNILETHHIIKQYAEHRALDDVSLSVPKGCIFGLLGPNGAGKTSLIRIINQITAPDSGEVILDGERLRPDHIKRIGYLPEERGLYKKMKVGEQLLYLAQLKGLTEKQAMEMLKVWFVKFDIKTWWNKQIQDLSKGMQQKVQFVATVLHEPDLIILDEPFSGFDPINANLIKDEILELREKGKTIIFSTHRMESVEELCDYIALINRSHKILDGSKRAIKEQFKTHTYHIEYQGTLSSLPTAFEVLRNQPLEDNFQRADIKIPPDASVNDLIRHLIDTISIRSFGENIPSMNDIFIQTVGENND
ncbi:ABC transporter ATP-binding protein [Spirosoma panaciterrae]|uniref:ABC transporter ATP-binding protein n=1 Tax=Spirosoma panaciterrae TaxID=496058 RepID=UPI0003632722|nr:ATP-binding cassette domain-containing protein [Spirosoma panaciterrae]